MGEKVRGYGRAAAEFCLYKLNLPTAGQPAATRVAHALDRESDVWMKLRFWLFKRGSIFCLQDSETGKKNESLGSREPQHAERLGAARDEAAKKPLLDLTPGGAYLSANDPKLAERK